MTDKSNIGIPNLFAEKSYFSQFGYSTDNFSIGGFYIPDFNSYTANFCFPDFSQIISSFDWSLSNFNIPTLNLGTSVFGFTPVQLFNNYILQPPIQINYASVPSQKTNTANSQAGTYVPVRTDAEESVTTNFSSVRQIQTEESKQKRAVAGLDSKTYIAEEIIPGCFVHKLKNVNVKDLKPYMKETLAKLSKKAEELGYTLVVSDGFRSHETQIAVKRKKPRLAATPGKSAHEYGVAIDVSLFKDGKFVGDIYKKVPEFGRYAQSLDLEWGATWKTKYEPWHFNFQDWKELADVRNEYRQYNHLA